MSLFLIVPKERVSEMDELNAIFTDRFCTTTETTDGVLLTNSDKLDYPYWSAYHAFLSSLKQFNGQPIWAKHPVEVEETEFEYER
jgi:hypothetical protein